MHSLFDIDLVLKKLLCLLFIEAFKYLIIVTLPIISKSWHMQTCRSVSLGCKNRGVLLFAIIKHLSSVWKKLTILMVIVSYKFFIYVIFNFLYFNLVQIIHFPAMKHMFAAFLQNLLSDWGLSHLPNSYGYCFMDLLF